MRPVYLRDGLKLNIIRNVFFLGESSFLAGVLAVSYFLVKRKLNKILLLTNLILTFSRLGWIAFIVGYILEVFIQFRKKKFVINILIALILLSTIGNIIILRLTYFSSSDISSIARFNQIITSINMFINNPIFGVGLGRYGYEYHKYEVITGVREFKFPLPGSIYTLILSEFGILGAIVFGSFFILILNKCRSKRKKIAFVVLAVYWLNSPFINLLWEWVFIGIMISNSEDYITNQRYVTTL
jgi:O-antigen ligase